MATVDLAVRARGVSNPKRVPYFVQNLIDFAAAATSKGSALAAADIIEAIDVPAGTMIINAGIQVVTLATGESSDVALDLGVTGVDADVFVDGFDLDAAVVGAVAQNPAAFQPVIIGGTAGATADTIDVLIQAATTAPTGGIIRVWALLTDINDTQDKFGGVAARDTSV
jgi:hypothetical protein